MENKFSKVKKYLKEKNRFILQNPRSFEQKYALTISKGNTIVLSIFLILFFSFLVYLIISFTSLKNFIPGYPSKGSELYQIDQENQAIINEIQKENRDRELWIANLQSILSNSDSVNFSTIKDTLTKDTSFDYKSVVFERVKEDSILRKRVSLFSIRDKNSILLKILTDVLLFDFPSESEFDVINDDGISKAVFSPKYKSKIEASMDGTTINTTDKSVVIQHFNNVTSVYENFDDIKTKIGDRISKGETLGIAKDSVFYFQLWYNGESIPLEILNELRQ